MHVFTYYYIADYQSLMVFYVNLKYSIMGKSII